MAVIQTADWAIKKAFLHAQRKDVAPQVGTSKYNALLAMADSMTRIWASEPNVEWNSLYERQDIGTLPTSGVIDLDETIDYISQSEEDPVLVGSTPYKVVSARQLYRRRGGNVCAKVGNTLVFPVFSDESLSKIGSSVSIPAILAPDEITSGSDELQVDDPMWLAVMMAAEFVRNDGVKQGQYENLLAYADNIMQKMKEANEGSVNEVLTPWAPLGEDFV